MWAKTLGLNGRTIVVCSHPIGDVPPADCKAAHFASGPTRFAMIPNARVFVGPEQSGRALWRSTRMQWSYSKSKQAASLNSTAQVHVRQGAVINQCREPS